MLAQDSSASAAPASPTSHTAHDGVQTVHVHPFPSTSSASPLAPFASVPPAASPPSLETNVTDERGNR